MHHYGAVYLINIYKGEWPYKWPGASSAGVNYTPAPSGAGLLRCKFTYNFRTTKYFLGKFRILTKKR